MPTAWDDGVLSARVIALAAHSVGFGAAATGRLFRVPRLPSAVAAPIVLLDYQPALRRLLEAGIGRPRTDLLLSTLTAASFTLVQAPPPLAIEALLRASVVGEVLANRRAWLRSTHRPVPETAAPDLAAAGPVDRHLERAAWAQLGGVAAVGAATGSVRAAGTAALVTAPKAARTARESFASTLSRGLADDHGVLCRGPDVLRRLDAVTALVVDPRALLTADLRVSRIRGVDDHRRAAVWEAARTAIESGELDTGWHSLAGIDNAAEPGDDPDAAVLISPVRDALAGAVLEQARQAGITVHSVDDEALGTLRSAFDDLGKPGDSTDSDLRSTVERLQESGATVAVLSVDCPRAVLAADVSLALRPESAAPADLLVPDLRAVWRILRALPAARTASRRGIEIASGASLLGSLLMIPGTHGRGPGPSVSAPVRPCGPGAASPAACSARSRPARARSTTGTLCRSTGCAGPSSRRRRVVPLRVPDGSARRSAESAVPPPVCGTSAGHCAPNWPIRSPRSWRPVRRPVPCSGLPWTRSSSGRFWSATPRCRRPSDCMPNGSSPVCSQARTPRHDGSARAPTPPSRSMPRCSGRAT